MSGSFSIIREVANLYPTTQIPLWDRKLFWATVWIAFIVSSLTAWFLKNRELAAEKAKSLKPKIVGDIEEVHAVMAWDCQSTEGRKNYDLYVTIKASIRNVTPAPTTAKFRLHAATSVGSINSTACTLDDLVFKHPQRRARANVHISAVGSVLEEMPDLAKTCRTPFKLGDEQEGWLRFVIPTRPKRFSESIQSLILTISDTYGGSHSITVNRDQWHHTGEIVTKLSEELAHRREEEKLRRIEDSIGKYL